MTIALSLLALLAIAAAVGAASRVQRQLAAQATQPGQTQGQLTKSALPERESPAAQKPRVELDQDRDQTLRPSSPSAESAIVDPTELLSKTPLAASLTVTEVLHPAEVEVSIHHSDLVEESSEEPLPVNLLSEIEALDHSDHHGQIAHLSRYLEHSDSVMRAAAVFALGELLAKCDRAETEEISALLHQFNQDANPQVRQQAVTAFGKMQSS
ncbi:HEAT repeat domain-containing protein [Phormidesmis priestleyi]